MILAHLNFPDHSFDCMNDQENSDVQDKLPNDSGPNESFNEQQPSDLDPTQSNEPSTSIITYHNQPSEISDDELRKVSKIIEPKTTMCI